MGGRELVISWGGRRAVVWLPDRLDQGLPSLSDPVIRGTERALAAVARAGDRLPTDWEPLARLLLRAEGVASSQIEGIRAPLDEIAAAELGAGGVSETAGWVADNLAAIQTALAERDADLTVDTLHRWHARLMGHSNLPVEMVGAFRPVQGWIGGTSPVDAVFVPPPPDVIAGLMDDLIAFIDAGDVDPITQAAVAHAQFETIHPYADGNGRIGRVLVSWLLARRIGVAVPPPLSVLIARDPGGYLSGLHAFRAGELNAWIGWFSEVVARAGEAASALIGGVGDLLTAWEARVADLRGDAAGRRAVPLMVERPVISAALLAARLTVSERAARNALSQLAERGIVAPLATVSGSRGRPRNWWVASELIELLRTWGGGPR